MNTNEFTQETIINNQNKILAAQAMILASLEKLDLVLENQGKLELFLTGQVVGQKVETVGNGLNA